MGRKDWVPKGYVPMLVGRGKEERFLVRTKLLKKPSFVSLLQMAEQEFGFEQQGILRIPCDPAHFKAAVDAAAKAKS